MSIKWILTKTTGYQEIFLNNYMFVINIGVWVCQYNEGRLLSNKKNKCKMVHTSYILKHHVIYGKDKTKSIGEIWLIYSYLREGRGFVVMFKEDFIYIAEFFFFFGYTTRHVGSQFPD